MTDERTHKPVPVGELLERLHAEGFAIGPGVYTRVFNVIGRIFPDGLPNNPAPETLSTLRELIGPIVCRTATEQEKFTSLFATFIQTPDPGPLPELPDDENKQAGKTEPAQPLNSLHFLWILIPPFILGSIIWFLFFSDKTKPITDEPVIDSNKPTLNCSVNFAVQNVLGDSITFINRSPGLRTQQAYQWNFGDDSDSLITTKSIVGHRFKTSANQSRLGKVTLKAVGCTNDPQTYQEPVEYKPTALSFRRSPDQKNYRLSGWIPLALMGLGGLLTAGFWIRLLRQRNRKKSTRPADGPFFLSFPHQEDGIQPSLSLLNWAQQLQQREESERRMLAIGPSIWQTIRNGGMPTLRYEQIKRRPRYLVLLDNRSAYDQQAQLYSYLTGVLTTRDVDMDVFFFHADPRYAWSDLYPKGLPIADIYRLYGTHYLVLVTEGNRLLDYDTGEVAPWVNETLGGWDNRALLTPVYPQNWNYLEAALSRFFILLPTTPDGQLRLRDYFGQTDSTPTYDDLLRQFEVLPGTPNRGIFGRSIAKLTVADVEQFLQQSPGIDSIDASMQDWLIQWACATAVFPTPDWAITLAIGKALDDKFTIDGLVTSTNLLKITALPWLRQDTIPEPLRTNLLANLRPDVKLIARQTVIDLLNELRPAPGSMAFEEWQLRLWEQEFHAGQSDLKQLSTYHNTDLIKDPEIREHVSRQHQKSRIQNQYVPLMLLLLLTLAPLLLYTTPPKTQMASWAVPFYKLDLASVDSAAYYNNRAVDVFARPSRKLYETLHKEATTFLYKSLRQRLTFDAVYNLNIARYNLGVSMFDRTTNSYGPRDLISLDKIVSPNDGVLTLMRPVKQFDEDWVPDSSIARTYLMLLTTNAPTDSIFRYVQSINRASAVGDQNQGIGIGSAVNQREFNANITAAKRAFRTPGILEMARTGYVTTQDSLTLAKFSPSAQQRDSLVSLEAARIVLYFGGPRQTTNIPVEAMPISTPPPVGIEQPKEAYIDRNVSPITGQKRPNVSKRKKSTATKATQNRPIKNPQINPPATSATEKNPVSPPIYQQQQQQQQMPVQQEPPVAQSPVQQRPQVDSGRVKPASENVAPTNNSPSTNPNNSPVQQPVQQQQVQQELPIAEQIKALGLNPLSREQAKCAENNVSVQDKTIRSGESILIPLTQAVDMLDWRCGSTQLRLYSKQPFNYVLIDRTTNGLIQWTLYRRTSPTAR